MDSRAGSHVCREQGKFYEGLIDALRAYAQSVFSLMEPQSDGKTLGDHLRVVFERTGKKPPALEAPPFPTELDHVWLWWQTLSASYRVSNGFGVGVLPIAEFEAWCRLVHIVPTPFEVDAFSEIEGAYRRIVGGFGGRSREIGPSG